MGCPVKIRIQPFFLFSSPGNPQFPKNILLKSVLKKFLFSALNFTKFFGHFTDIYFASKY